MHCDGLVALQINLDDEVTNLNSGFKLNVRVTMPVAATECYPAGLGPAGGAGGGIIRIRRVPGYYYVTQDSIELHQ